MSRSRTSTLPPKLVLVSMLSTSVTVTVSIVYIVLSILALVYRFECIDPEDASGSSFFINTVFRTYVQNNDCANTIALEDLTQADTVFILTIITLCSSALCILAGIALIAVIKSENQDNVQLYGYVYVGVCFVGLIVDLTFGTHFGMDFGNLSSQLDQSNPGLGMNYERDAIRLGALLFMTVCLKGFATHAFNILLLVLIVVYIVRYQEQLKREQHPIHKLGALNAYDQSRRQDPWHLEPQMMYRGPQNNPAYDMSPPRSPRRDPPVSDYVRSDSWQTGSRPFSYLEENKRAAGAATGVDPRAGGEAWRRERDWPPPPVPAPDYSPHTPRRLKSALKPSYM